MAWRASGVVDQRKKFVQEYASGEWTMAALCRIYEISRESGYKWLRRSQVEGEAGSKIAAVRRFDIPIRPSRRSSSSCWHCASDMQRGERANCGLTYNRSSLGWCYRRPAPSALLKREGLTVPRRQLRKIPPYTQPFQQAVQPNQLWCADFKGWFLTSDRQRIDPLTITDTASRYLLRCQAVEKANTEQVLAIFEAASGSIVCRGLFAPTMDHPLPPEPLPDFLPWRCTG